MGERLRKLGNEIAASNLVGIWSEFLCLERAKQRCPDTPNGMKDLLQLRAKTEAHSLYPYYQTSRYFALANTPEEDVLSFHPLHHLSMSLATEIFNGTQFETFVPPGFPAPFFGICFFEIEPGRATTSFESLLHQYGIQFLKALSATFSADLSVPKNRVEGLFLRDPWAICRIAPNQPLTSGLPDYRHIPPTVVFQPTDNLLQYLYYDPDENLFLRLPDRK